MIVDFRLALPTSRLGKGIIECLMSLRHQSSVSDPITAPPHPGYHWLAIRHWLTMPGNELHRHALAKRHHLRVSDSL
jgi:hypothetical protein